MSIYKTYPDFPPTCPECSSEGGYCGPCSTCQPGKEKETVKKLLRKYAAQLEDLAHKLRDIERTTADKEEAAESRWREESWRRDWQIGEPQNKTAGREPGGCN